MSSLFDYKRQKQGVPKQPKGEGPSLFQHRREKDALNPAINQAAGPFPFENENDLEREIERSSARTLSRMGETIAGFPGDVANFIQGFTGGKEKIPLPTSAQLQAKSEQLTRGYTKPQTKFEESTDEFVKDVANISMPGGRIFKAAGRFKGILSNTARIIGLPLVGQLAKEGVKELGGSEGRATAAKVGSMVIIDLLLNRGKGGAKGYATRMLDEAEKSIPQGTKVNVGALEAALNNLESSLQKGGGSPSKVKAFEQINEVRKRITNGELDPTEFPALRRAVNDTLDQLGGFNIEMPIPVKKRTIANLNDVKKEIIKAGEDYGRTQNPKFLQLWSEGNEALTAIAKSNRIANLIEKYFGGKFKSIAAKTLFGLSGPGALGGLHFIKPSAVAGTAGLAAIPAAAYQGLKLIERFRNSPALQRYYTNVLKNAAAGNSKVMVQNLSLLDKKLAEEEKKERQLIEKHLND